MEQVHLKDEGIAEYSNCIECHPTGEPDEARKFMEEQSEQKTTNSLDVYRNTAQQLQQTASGGY
jgi:hypothetical protein